jgi:hypothetical protein
MGRYSVRTWLLAGLTCVLLALTILIVPNSDAPPAAASPADPQVSATVGSQPTGAKLPPGFTGLSLEYSALHLYTGRDPRAVNPVLIALLRNLVAPGGSPVLRIGGNSADRTWWPIRGMIPPGGVSYRLTEGWMRTTQALAAALGARMILDLNLAAGRPGLAATEARTLLSGVGRRYIDAFEIGNEPDVYSLFPWYRDRRGRVVFARGSSWGLSQYLAQFARWRAALPQSPVAGPAFAELTWLSGLGRFIAAEPGLRLVTLHRYPLRACLSNPADPGYPTIPALLSDGSSAGLAQQVAPYAANAHRKRLGFRLDELNSASCSGKPGVSDTFASALWMLDTLFNLASAGVDGVNVHSLPGAAYELFTFSHPAAGWQAFVHPEYYALLMFGQAFPAGAQLLPTSVNPNGPVKVWATRGQDFRTRVVVINKDPANSYSVQLQISGLTGPANLTWLQAPSVSATSGVTLGGQSFGSTTTTGTLGSMQTQSIQPVLGNYTIQVPPGSAVLLAQ